MTTRRIILLLAVSVVAALVGAPRIASAQPAGETIERAAEPLDILFLGGTGFLGPYQVEYALARGHRVTLFNRGRTDADLFEGRVEVLIGNRDSTIEPGLSALAGDRRWDIVIDNSGYVPRHVRDSVAMLKDRVGRYVYVSTVAVYDSSVATVFDENAALWPAPPDDVEQVTGETYGPLKAECDRIVQAAFGDRATIVRPTYIIGPEDRTDRFTYWIQRVARGGVVLGPIDPSYELQWVDARDLCPWIVQLGERDQGGIFNASGPSAPVTWGQALESLASLSDRAVTFRWATPEALEAAGLSGLPMVRQTAHSLHFDGGKAEAAGLRYRPLADTARATLAWWRSQSAERRASARNWPTEAQEQAALEALRDSAK
ncbi:MAG: NAD-dependent epimerase/dehydratase family protein [Phycisphaerales bacterium]